MRRKNIVNLSAISVFALAGVIAFQAIWVNSTLSASKAHAREHIRNTLYLNQDRFCDIAKNESLEAARIFIYGEVKKELSLIKKPVDFSVLLVPMDSQKPIIDETEHQLNQDFKCNGTIYRIKVICDYGSWLWVGEIFWWSVISVLLVLILATSVAISLIHQSRYKKLEDIKRDFVSNMTHELKTPIATINVASQMLISPPIPEEKVFKYGRIIFDENLRLQKLVDKVLMLSIFDESQQVYNFEKINFSEIISESVEHLNVLSNKVKANIKIDLPEEIIYVKGDKTHLKNIVTNILENALKYCDIEPKISIILEVINSNELMLRIADNGPGVPDSEKDKIFNRFHRSHNPKKNRAAGFGLGLSYVQKVVQIHGGKISVTDNAERGAVFIIILPIGKS